jgi:EAL domain-containing protein (putative c-di-GMP-specific phosphodiesterase class I)
VFEITETVRAIVALASDFGQQAIAEVVENEHTASVRRDLGVTCAQGHLFGRPEVITDRTWDATQAVVQSDPVARIVR